MERTFDTPHPVRLSVQNEVGLVTIVAGDRDTTEVLVSADSPAADDIVERTVVERRDDQVVVKVPRQGKGFFRRSERDRPGQPARAQRRDRRHRFGGRRRDRADRDSRHHDRQRRRHHGRRVVGVSVARRPAATSPWATSAASSAWTPHRGACAARASANAPAFSSASGEVEIGLAQDRVDIKTSSGRVRLGELARGADVVNVSGDVRVLSLAEGTLRVRSVSGDVSVGVAEGVELHVDVQTMTGRVHSEIPIDDAPAREHSGRKADVTRAHRLGRCRDAAGVGAGELSEHVRSKTAPLHSDERRRRCDVGADEAEGDG